MTHDEAKAELDTLTDNICLRDHSARIRRIELLRFLELPTPTEAEAAVEHQRLMDEAMKCR